MTYPELETADGALPTTEPTEPSDAIAAAIELLASAKAVEARAVAARIAAEQAVLAFLPSKPEGSLTRTVGAWKVTATWSMNRSLDVPALAAVRSEIPEALFESAVEYKPALKLAGVRHLRLNEPAAYALLAQAITCRPAKPAVKIEAID